MLADSTLPMGVQTVAASAAAALWRVVIMPVDTLKTNLQVHGSGGIEVLKERVRTEVRLSHALPVQFFPRSDSLT